MKKLILLAALATGLMFTAKAQENGFGIRAGLNLSNARGDFKDAVGGDIKRKAGFNIGVIYDYGSVKVSISNRDFIILSKVLKPKIKKTITKRPII